MGSTLTNTQPKDTYKSLLKTSDSTELSATAKYVSDGNGNDSKLALSTGNVGINTTSPGATLEVNGVIRVTDYIEGSFYPYSTTLGSGADVTVSTLRAGSTAAKVSSVVVSGGTAASNAGTIIFNTLSVERARITANGLTFNGDTAAANALDDYEEGTWTPVLGGTSTLGNYSYVGGGAYRKIGSQVTVWCSLIDIVEISAGSGQMIISGLPYTIANDSRLARLAVVPYIRQALSTRNNLLAVGGKNTTNVYLSYDNNAASGGNPMTIAGDYTANMDIGFVLTYYV